MGTSERWRIGEGQGRERGRVRKREQRVYGCVGLNPE